MQKGNSIIKFSKEHYFLSNMYPCPITYKGLNYKCAEAAFQAQKVHNEIDKIEFTKLNGKQAKKLGGKNGKYIMNNIELQKWNKQSQIIMEEIVRCKFSQNPKLKQMLIDTNDLRLIEGNNHDDNLYGIQLQRVKDSSRKLKTDENGLYILSKEENEYNNKLGKILMKIRKELQ